MTAWIGKRTAAISVSRRIARFDRWVRHAATVTAATISPTTIATQR